MKNRKFYIRLAFNILRVIIPAGLLTIIFLNIDIKALAEAFKKVNLIYFFLGIFFANIMQYTTGAIRWNFMIRKEIRTESALRYIAIYWTAMFYGYFVPSNVGMDVYRVATAGKKQKNYEQHIVTLLGEKIYTLAFSIAIVFLSYAMVSRQIKGSDLAYSMDVLAILLILMLLAVLIVYLLLRKKFSAMILFIKRKIYTYADAISKKLASRVSFNIDSFSTELTYIGRKNFVAKTLAFTLIIRLFLVLGSYFLFLALGVRLSFWTLLFANSVFFLLFILPISFGSLGVREGAYILVFGLFGISPETALAASFLSLAGLIFTISAGGIISLTENFKKIKTSYGE